MSENNEQLDENLNIDNDGIETDENVANDLGDDEAQKKEAVNEGIDNNGIYGSPENYDYKDIKLPEGYEYDEDMLNEFNKLNRETNLSQAQANKYMEFGIKLAQKSTDNLPNVIKQVKQAQIAKFQQALNTDKEIGGGDKAQMNAYLDVADKGYTAFANDEVKAALADAGLNYHPAIVKMFHRIGELVGDDKIFASKQPIGKPADAAEILYGS